MHGVLGLEATLDVPKLGVPGVEHARGNLHWRDWYFIAEQPAPAQHLAHPEGYAALRIVLVTVPRVSRSTCIRKGLRVWGYIWGYRSTSLIRAPPPVGPCSSLTPRNLG